MDANDRRGGRLKIERYRREQVRPGKRREVKLVLTTALAEALRVNAARRDLDCSEVVMRLIEQHIPEAAAARTKRRRSKRGRGDGADAEAA